MTPEHTDREEELMADERCHECGRTPSQGHTFKCLESWPTGYPKPYVTQEKADAFEEWLSHPTNRRRWDDAIEESRRRLEAEAMTP